MINLKKTTTFLNKLIINYFVFYRWNFFRLTLINFSLFLLIYCFINIQSPKISAQINNPAINNAIGEYEKVKDGKAFTNQVMVFWNGIIILGGLALLLNIIIASIQWITAGGDSGKIEKSRDVVIQSIIGMVILTSAFVIIKFLNNLLFPETNLLNPVIPSPE